MGSRVQGPGFRFCLRFSPKHKVYGQGFRVWRMGLAGLGAFGLGFVFGILFSSGGGVWVRVQSCVARVVQRGRRLVVFSLALLVARKPFSCLWALNTLSPEP